MYGCCYADGNCIVDKDCLPKMKTDRVLKNVVSECSAMEWSDTRWVAKLEATSA